MNKEVNMYLIPELADIVFQYGAEVNDSAVIKQLKNIFEYTNMEVEGRNYSLKYKGKSHFILANIRKQWSSKREMIHIDVIQRTCLHKDIQVYEYAECNI